METNKTIYEKSSLVVIMNHDSSQIAKCLTMLWKNAGILSTIMQVYVHRFVFKSYCEKDLKKKYINNIPYSVPIQLLKWSALNINQSSNQSIKTIRIYSSRKVYYRYQGVNRSSKSKTYRQHNIQRKNGEKKHH